MVSMTTSAFFYIHRSWRSLPGDFKPDLMVVGCHLARIDFMGQVVLGRRVCAAQKNLYP